MEQKSTQKIKKRTADYGTMKSLDTIIKEGQEAYRELHGEVCPAIGDGESFLASFAQKVVEGVRENVAETPIKRAHTYASENADEYRAFDAGQESFKERTLRRLARFSEGRNNQQTK